jgi:SAM-dependent methyltransferase
VNPQEVRETWADRDGEFSPTYYAHHGPNETSEHLVTRLDDLLSTPPEDAAVLELGCSAGRHLERLRTAGYGDLHGLEINPAAFDVLAETYPELEAAATLHAGDMVDLLPEFDADRFDAVVSVETLQHVHPADEWVLDEAVRVAADLLVVVENEHGGDGAGDYEHDAPSPATDMDPDRPAAPTEVTYVREDLPLYHRDWGATFTARGCEQVAVADRGRDTLRAFRVP